MIQIIVRAQQAQCRKSSEERITSGMVGKQVCFDFSAAWDGMAKTAVFEGSGAKKDVILNGNMAEIPAGACASAYTEQTEPHRHRRSTQTSGRSSAALIRAGKHPQIRHCRSGRSYRA